MFARLNRSDCAHRTVLRQLAAAAVSIAAVAMLSSGCSNAPAPQPSGPVLSGWDPSTGRTRTGRRPTGADSADINGATRDTPVSGNGIGTTGGGATGAGAGAGAGGGAGAGTFGGASIGGPGA